MLEQVLDYIHNYFVSDVHVGDFSISSGSISLPFLKNGQRFKIIGSDLNDGIYTYVNGVARNADGDYDVCLADENFYGEIWSMAVPPSVLSLSNEITEWSSKYSDAVNSPYQSESFGGYSYTKAQGYSGNGAASALSWKDVFRNRLNAWRKIA